MIAPGTSGDPGARWVSRLADGMCGHRMMRRGDLGDARAVAEEVAAPRDSQHFDRRSEQRTLNQDPLDAEAIAGGKDAEGVGRHRVGLRSSETARPSMSG